MAAYFTAGQRSARPPRAEKCGYLPSAAPGEGHAGAAVAVAVHDAALRLQAHRRPRGSQPHGDADHRRVVQGGDERGAARADGRRGRRIGRAVLGALLRGPAQDHVALARDDVDQPLGVGLVQQPLAARRAPHAHDLAAHRAQRRVGRELARAQAGAVDHGVGVELVERGDVMALDRAAERAQAVGEPRQVDGHVDHGRLEAQPLAPCAAAPGPPRATTGRARRRPAARCPRASARRCPPRRPASRATVVGRRRPRGDPLRPAARGRGTRAPRPRPRWCPAARRARRRPRRCRPRAGAPRW